MTFAPFSWDGQQSTDLDPGQFGVERYSVSIAASPSSLDAMLSSKHLIRMKDALKVILEICYVAGYRRPRYACTVVNFLYYVVRRRRRKRLRYHQRVQP